MVNNTNENKRRGVQDLVAMKIVDVDTASVHYMDFTLVNTPEEKEEKIGLSVFSKILELEERKVTSKISLEQSSDLRRMYGIDTESMVENVIRNEMEQSVDKEITKLIETLGERSAIGDRTKFQKWANKWFGYEPKVLVGNIQSLDFSRKLVSNILKYSNKIASMCRRGPGNFIICSHSIGSSIQDNSAFIFSPLQNLSLLSNSSIYHIGTLANLDVYINPNMRHDDMKITVGRKTDSLDQPGIVFLKKTPDISKIEDPMLKETKVIMQQKMIISEVGSANVMFYTFTVTEKPHNLLRHLIKKYIK
jgi:hypothetical protein